jgi:hypothetical protein
MSLTPKRGGMMPLRRPDRRSWNTNGSQKTGMSPMYSTAGRATITSFEMTFISFAAK